MKNGTLRNSVSKKFLTVMCDKQRIYQKFIFNNCYPAPSVRALFIYDEHISFITHHLI